MGSFSRHPLRYRKPQPSLPPSPPSSGCDCRPSPTRASGNRPSWRPPASASRGPGTRPGIPPLGGDRSQASAPHGTGEPRGRVRSGLRRQTRDGVGGWTGQGGSPLPCLYQRRLGNPSPAMLGDKGVLAFMKRTLFAIP